MELERNYIGIWGSGGYQGAGGDSASDISKNQMKWKPDIYFLKRKLHIFFLFFESLCSEIGNKLH